MPPRGERVAGNEVPTPKEIGLRTTGGLWDNWSKEEAPNTFICDFCCYFCNFRCRRHAPRGQEGWPAVFPTDWCGDHKMNKATMRSL